MDCHCIPHTEFPSTSRLFSDYLYQFPKVSQFYSYDPFADDGLSSAAKNIPFDAALRKQVVTVLREQNRLFGAGEKSLENLSRLEKHDAIAVVTGHQVCLFSGPTFGIYKTLTAIKHAQALCDQGQNAIPVLWLATEDHDLAEANHCYVQDRDGNPYRLENDSIPPVAGASVGGIPLGDSILRVLRELRSLLPETPSTEELLKQLEDCYRPERTYGEAFGRLMTQLFGEFGIVLIDPMDPRLHALSAGVFESAIRDAATHTKNLTARNQQLTESGYHAQVHVADDFTLLFVQVNGQRRALRIRDGKFATGQGDQFSADDLLAILKSHPERLSANVLLRPVMQDELLPTIAYVAGPSELAYYAQAGVVSQKVLGRMSAVIPRASLTILDSSSSRILNRNKFTLQDLFGGKQAIRDKIAARVMPTEVTEAFRKTAADLELGLQAIQKVLTQLDPTLADATANGGKKMQYQLSALEQKATLSIQKHSEQIERDSAKLENFLYPAKTPQERYYGGINVLARYGTGILRELYELIPLHTNQHQVIKL